MPLPPWPSATPYQGDLRYGVRRSAGIDAISAQFLEMAHPDLRPIPKPPDPRWVPMPGTCDWISPVEDWEVLGNDTIGDCVQACMAHAIEAMTDAVGTRADITRAQTIRAYSDITGYNPATGLPDDGTVIASAMSYWANTGIGGYRINGSTHSNAIGHPAFYPGMIKRSIFYMGTAILSFSIPDSAEVAFRQGQPWVSGMSGNSSLHCVPALAYDDQWCDVITWGSRQRVSWGFVEEHLHEMWAVLAPAWIGPDGRAPCGVPGDLLAENLPGWLTVMAL